MICFPWILIIVLQTVEMVSNQIPKLLIKVSHKDIYLVTCCLIHTYGFCFQLSTAICFYADDIIVYANQLQLTRVSQVPLCF